LFIFYQKEELSTCVDLLIAKCLVLAAAGKKYINKIAISNAHQKPTKAIVVYAPAIAHPNVMAIAIDIGMGELAERSTETGRAI